MFTLQRSPEEACEGEPGGTAGVPVFLAVEWQDVILIEPYLVGTSAAVMSRLLRAPARTVSSPLA